MNSLFVAPIVEGHGELESVPKLLHRIAARSFGGVTVRVNAPIRVKLGSFIRGERYFHSYLQLAAAKAKAADGIILVLLDCDGVPGVSNCPAVLGPDLMRKVSALNLGVPCVVALAVQEYESWFIASVRSLAGRYGLPHDIASPPDFERIRGAKQWLSDRMTERYDPTFHQLKMTHVFDLDLAASNSPSFARLIARLSSCAASLRA